MPTQAMSRKCQNRPRRNRRETTGPESPLTKTWPVMIRIQIRPTLTCVPWVPTRVKKADRKPLRSGPAPALIRPRNSRTSRNTKPAPSTKVKSSHDSTAERLPAFDESEAKPKVVLLTSSSAVSSAALFRLNSVLPADLPDHAEAQHEGQPAQHNADGGVLRHLDVLVGARRLVGDAALLHVDQRLAVAHFGQHRKIVGRRRRRGCPFERAAVVGIAGDVGRLAAAAGADGELHHDAGDRHQA